MLQGQLMGHVIFCLHLLYFFFYCSMAHGGTTTLWLYSNRAQSSKSDVVKSMLNSTTNGPHQRSPLAAPSLFNHALKWNVSKGAETAGALPFLAPSKANKSNTEPCLPSFWLELDGLRLISSGVIWCFISLGSPTDEKQRDRVVRLAFLTAEGSRMTEPEANNSHYPSASSPFGKKIN